MLDVTIAFVFLFLPAILTAVALLLWYRSLARPVLYAVASLLSLTGLKFLLQETLSPIEFTHFIGQDEGGFSVHEQRDSILPFLEWQLPVAAALVAIGGPFLWWLKKAFSRT